MVNIMTVKRTIETNKTAKTTVKKSTTKRVVSNINSFELDEKKMILTITIPVEWNKTQTGLKAKNLVDVPGKEYKKMSAVDKQGNEIYIFKTTFGYEPVVKETKISKDSLDTSKLSDEEQEVLSLLLKKMSK
jgi:hypothetical protein